ncbi:DUF4430 domain-containing protein [Latilactobacillus sakei]|uniref:DUF4430 domain-containing protein n=1 Tax=Latilactobacillus sakei TaxID=1599 RepID=UPI00203018F5|nr:DUF4430 domain-containing protein [Latilactobacillus sakei]MCM1598377.1 DUF4430 domain-containing protein [Latilactobacillus sakei]
MVKKRLLLSVASLVLLGGIGYGTYASVQQQPTAVKQASEQSTQSKKVAHKAVTKHAESTSKKTTTKIKAKETKRSVASKQAQSKEAKQVSQSEQASVAKKEQQASASAKQTSTSQSATTATPPTTTRQSASSAVVSTAQQSTQHAVSHEAPAEQPEPAAKKVTLSVYGPISEGNAALINHASLTIDDGETVLAVLKRLTGQQGMPLSYRGIGASAYVKGVNGLFEFDKGPQSGWLYRVNGVFSNQSCGVYHVKSGDVIDWLYTEDLGHDRHAPQG